MRNAACNYDTIIMPFTNLGLLPELIEAVTTKGYDIPTPIQSQAIPAILEGKDVIGGAQTGTGKTAAFGLPLLQLLAESQFNTKRARALILTPTRELAAQVEQNLVDYGKRLNLRSLVIFGGVGFQPQINALRRGLDIIVATPGRLLDLCQRGEANLSLVQILVLDEADRMLDMGFIHDIRKILKLLPEKRQNLLFSATYSKEIKKLSDSILNNPVEVSVSPRNSTADRVDQEAYSIGQKSKRTLLSSMIIRGKWTQTLVFTRTKHGANRLAKQLESDGIDAMAIHGNKSQSARELALRLFKQNRICVLVATDIAARGLDISDLPHVVNYELPNVPEDYIHRIGRTGRAGKSGIAVSLVCDAEGEYFQDIEKLLKKSIPFFTIDHKGERKKVDRSQWSRRKPAVSSSKKGRPGPTRQQGWPFSRRRNDFRPRGAEGGQGRASGRSGPSSNNRRHSGPSGGSFYNHSTDSANTAPRRRNRYRNVGTR